ncbi:MAG: cytochrome P450 [Deltaproteobacteria bacterium]|nr:cytochrome P450 [Deltaproteobacteria bacterium]
MPIKPDFDLLDRNFYAADPWPVYAWLREFEPVYWDEKNEFWWVSRHEDVAHVSKHPELFSSAKGTRPNVQDPDRSMINQDDPRHTWVRSFVYKGFTPRRLGEQEKSIRAIAKRIVDNVAQRGECEFVEDVAARLPMAMIGGFLGIPEQDFDQLRHWSDVMTLGSDAEDTSEVTTAFVDYAEYVKKMIEDRRDHPRDDLVSILVHAEVGGKRLEENEIISESLLLLVGGSETSRNVTASAMEMLSRHPDQKAYLIDNPGAIRTAVDEFIRWSSPVLNMKRTATRDVELRGKTIRKDERVMIMYPSANRDEYVFVDPEDFDVKRDPNPHIAFGIGAHFCVGSNLARLQIRIIFEELLARLPDIHVEPGFEVSYAPSVFVSGFLELPVRFEKRP